jgi:hypothetical protein
VGTDHEEKSKVSRLWATLCSNWGTTKGKKYLGWIKWAYGEWRFIFFVEEESELKEEMGSNHHELESEEEKYESEDES